MQATVFLILIVFAVVLFHEKHGWFAIGPLFAALGQALMLPAIWRQHQAAKSGAIIYRAASRPETQLPRVVSIAVVFLVTAFVALCSAFIIYIVSTYFRTQTGITIGAVALLAMWVFVGYCWYQS